MKQSFILAGICVSLIGLPAARGQSIGPSTVNATGGSGPIGGTIYDWSIGEMSLVGTFSAAGVIVTQGVLQNDIPGEGVGKVSLAGNLVVFPNPASTIVNLQYTATSNGKLSYRLMDLLGKTVITKSLDVRAGITTEPLHISELAVATYMLEVSLQAENGAAQTISYKIEKLK